VKEHPLPGALLAVACGLWREGSPHQAESPSRCLPRPVRARGRRPAAAPMIGSGRPPNGGADAGL